MNFLLSFKTAFLLIASICSLAWTSAQNVDINSARFDFPNPTFPYYHLTLEVSLPYETYVDSEIHVNGKKLRFSELMAKSEYATMNFNHPAIAHRPPSAYALSENNKKYKEIVLVAWYWWEPGMEYDVEVEVRLKNQEDKSDQDRFVTSSRSLVSPRDAPMFDRAWKNYKSVVVSETAGFDRIGEPVEVLLPFYIDESKNLKNDVRVAAFDPATHELTEIPSQVYDIMIYSEVDDPDSHQDSGTDEKVPYWHPTTTARLTFLADVPAHTSRVYLVYYNNPNAREKVYQTDLVISGNDSVGTTITNEFFSARLDPKSGALMDITLGSLPDSPLFHGKETNGAIQWNPDIYSPPTPWDHTSDWTAPYQRSFSGPVNFELHTWGTMNEYWGVEASTTYRFYASVPYFTFASSMRMKETIQTLALRNGEMVFDKDLLDRVAWYDAYRDSVLTYDLHALPTLTELRMADDLPWITFYNSETGIGFAGIQLGYHNSGIENVPRLLNPSFYVTIGPWVYWARALSLSYVSANHQQVIPAMAGNTFSEKWAFITYDALDENTATPYALVEKWQKKLTSPLKVRLVEEVDDRVSETIDEIMSGGESPWDK